MDESERKIPKVFISYSWTSEEHKSNVIEFATYLMNNRVEAILDEWDAHEGMDLNYFMEKNVKIICSPQNEKREKGSMVKRLKKEMQLRLRKVQ